MAKPKATEALIVSEVRAILDQQDTQYAGRILWPGLKAHDAINGMDRLDTVFL